jgi:hypothetical protein
MLRLTSETYKFFPAIFANIIPQKIKKDVWDFGDKIIIGTRNSNKVQSWEAIDRNSVSIDGENSTIYIDVLQSIDECGHGPCEKQTYDCFLYESDALSLEVRDNGIQTLLVSIKNAEETENIYANLNYFLNDKSFAPSKYDWIGQEKQYERPLFISRKANDKKKREVLAKTPRIALTAAVVNDKRKRV